jgi:tetratricopeptide (TPR) repeat protein
MEQYEEIGIEDSKAKILNQSQLVRRFKDLKCHRTQETCFCFLLGAGASKSSGIPTGWELSKRWWDELKEDLGELEWMKDITDQNVGGAYTDLYKARFASDPASGYQEFEHLMEGKTPWLGYVILAQILAAGQHNFVITTNFDYLIEDAVRLYTSQKPFIAGHETLAKFISLYSRRPTIIKVHRDLFLHPFNSPEETDTLKEEWANALSPLLGRFHLLVIGYGGNDGSLMNYLKQIKSQKRKSIYWCILKNQKINKKISRLLTEKDFIVEIGGFDELMYALNEALDFDIFKDLDKDDHPLVQAAKEIVKKFDDARTKLAATLSSKENKDVDISALQSILSGGVSKILLEVYKEEDVRKKEELYRQGLSSVYSTNHYLLAAYAGFLYETGSADEGDEKYRQAVNIKPDDHKAYYNWGTYLGTLAQTKTVDEAEALYREAFKKYRQAISIKPDFHEAYYNWGTALGNLAKMKTGDEAEELYKKAFEKFRQAVNIKPDYHDAYYNWGTDLGNLAKTKTGDEAEALYNEAFEKFRQAVNIKPDKHEAYNNWGNVLRDLAQTKTGMEAEALYREAFEKFQQAVIIKPDYHEAYNNWGITLGTFAQTKTGDKAEVLYRKVIEKCRQAVNIKPDCHEAYNNWGNALGNLAQTKTGDEAEALYREAIEKYRQTVNIKPDDHKAYYNWGNALGNLAKTKTGDEAEALYREAIEKCRQSIASGGGYYNLACLYAVLSDREQALDCLEKSLERKEITTDFVRQDSDWDAYHNDRDFIALLRRFE